MARERRRDRGRSRREPWEVGIVGWLRRGERVVRSLEWAGVVEREGRARGLGGGVIGAVPMLGESVGCGVNGAALVMRASGAGSESLGVYLKHYVEFILLIAGGE